jgi:hypothetical protein
MTDLSVDVQNMGRWGIDFQDDPGVKDVPWYGPDGAEHYGALGYITWVTTDPGMDSGDTPIFWGAWHDSLEATIFEPQLLDWNVWPTSHEYLADWERELLGWNEHIAWIAHRNGNYSDDIWNLLNRA